MTRTKLGIALTMATMVGLTGCNSSSSGDGDGGGAGGGPRGDDHEHITGAVRALVSDQNGTLRLYDLPNGAVVWTHAFDAIGAGELSALNTSEDGRFAMINLRGTANGVAFLDSGVLVEPHDDHVHLEVEPPQLLDYRISGDDFGASVISHVASHAGRISAFFDGDPTLTDTAYAITIPLSNLTGTPVAAQVNQGNRHHGVALPATDNTLIMSVAEGGGTARTGVRIYEGATEVAAFPTNCAGLHGHAVIGEHYLFGCANAQGGTLVVTHDHDTGDWTGHQMDFPAGSALGISNFTAHPNLNFSLAPWGGEAFIRVHPSAETMLESDVLQLPAPACGYALRDDNGEQLLVLTVDGVLRAYDSADWSTGPELEVLDAFECTGTAPILKSVGSYAYLTDPGSGNLLEIEIHDDEIEIHGEIALEGEPRRLTLFRHPAGLEDHAH